jgi:hypothetical protein
MDWMSARRSRRWAAWRSAGAVMLKLGMHLYKYDIDVSTKPLFQWRVLRSSYYSH